MDTVSPSAETVASTVRALTKRLDGLIQTQDTHNDLDQYHTVAALGLLVRSDVLARAEALDAGALRVLTAALRMAKDSRVRRVVLATTLLLIHDNTLAQDAAVRAGVLPPLVASLDPSKNVSIKILALMVLHAIVQDNETHRVLLLHANVFRPLHALWIDGYGTEQRHAQQLLAALVAHSDAARAILHLEALHAKVHLPVALHSPGLAELWDAGALAHCVLERYDHTQSDNEPETKFAQLERELRQRDTPRIVELLVLEELYALILSDPGLAVSDFSAMKATVVPVCLERLHRTDQTDHYYAAYIPVNLMRQNNALCASVADAGAGGVDALIDLLSDGKQSTIAVLGVWIAEDRSGIAAHAALAAGALPLVVRMLCHGRPSERSVAASTLSLIVHQNAAAQTEALDAGAMADLLMALRGDIGYDAAKILFGALRALVEGNAVAQDAFVDAGGARVVSDLVASQQASGTVAAVAADAIMSLIAGHTRAQDAITQTGIIDLLIDQLMRPTGIQAGAAATALSALAVGHAANKATIVEGPAVGRLVELLHSDCFRTKFFAAAAIYYISKDRDGAPEAQAAFAAAGAIEHLVQILSDSQDQNMLVMVMGALSSLAHENRANQAMAMEAGAVALLIGMLRHGPSCDVYTVAATLALVTGTRTVDAIDGAEPVKNATEAITLLVDMLATPALSSQDKSHVAGALSQFVSNDPELQTVAINAGVLETLVALAPTVTSESACFVHALAGLITADSAQRAVAAGAVGPFVASLESGNPNVSVLSALQRIAEAPQRIETLLQAGLVPCLGRLLGHGDASTAATALLCTLAGASKSAASACFDTDIAARVERLVGQSTGLQQGLALYLALNLTVHGHTRQRMAELLPIDVLLGVLGTSECKESKALAICTTFMLTEDDVVQRARVIDAGAVDILFAILRESEQGPMVNSMLDVVALLISESRAEVDADHVAFVRSLLDTTDAEQKKRAAAALASITSVQNDALAWGLLDPLLEMLRCIEPDDNRAVSAAALSTLVDGHAQNQAAVAAAGAIPILVDMLERAVEDFASSNDEESVSDRQRWTARALANLVRDHPANAMAALREGVVPPLIGLVRTSKRAKNRADGVRALRCLVETGLKVSVDDERLMRVTAMEAGAIDVLEELLLDDQVSDQMTRDARATLALLVEKPPPQMAMRNAHAACVPRYC